MKPKLSLRVGGVPEHFNLPWQLAAERDVFSANNIDLSWTMYAGGTGAMTQALSNGSLDVAILLTEGFIAAAADGLEAHIAKVYIDTPLVWGIYTGSQSSLQGCENLSNQTIAVSRLGSGSHLMSMIHAAQRNEIPSNDQFKIVNSLHGAVQTLTAGSANVFYWEKYMTRPNVRSGELRLIGEFSAPWSSFLIIVSDEAMQKKRDAVLELLSIMNSECIAFKQDNNSAIQLSKRFDMALPEARKWLGNTQWNYDFRVTRESLENAKEALCSIGKCNNNFNIETLCASWMQIH